MDELLEDERKKYSKLNKEFKALKEQQVASEPPKDGAGDEILQNQIKELEQKIKTLEESVEKIQFEKAIIQ